MANSISNPSARTLAAQRLPGDFSVSFWVTAFPCLSLRSHLSGVNPGLRIGANELTGFVDDAAQLERSSRGAVTDM